jgi:hypothetical protein
MWNVKPDSKSELLYDWRFTANQFLLAISPLRLTTSNFILQLNTCGYSPYKTSSLTRGWVCRLQLLLVLASAVILSFDSRGTHDHILLSQIRDSPNLESQVPVFISPRNRVAQLYPQALGYIFVSSYDSQVYGGGIWPRLHTGFDGHGPNIKHRFQQSNCRCVRNRCQGGVFIGRHLTTAVSSGSTIAVFQLSCHNIKSVYVMRRML